MRLKRSHPVHAAHSDGHGRGRISRVGSLVCIMALGYLVSSAGAGSSEDVLASDSEAPYVHRITLYDHEGGVISPDDRKPAPYSPRATCGKCHDYAAIAHGWHFNATLDSIEPGRPWQPWLFLAPEHATLLPISGRNWPGVFAPRQAHLSHWNMIQRFGHHQPGGGYGEPSDEVIRAQPETLRWGISGNLEVDCLFCHNGDASHDPAEAARQIDRENYKWLPAAAAGLAVIRGDAADMPDDWDPYMPPSPDFPSRKPPKVIYDKSRFDPDDRVFLDITRRPSDDRCYFCHTVRGVGDGSAPRWLTGIDVHLAAGLTCTDCHRNNIDHEITRGYRGEARERNQPGRAAYTCEGCHLGNSSGDPETVIGGRYGAPRPLHRGFPLVHFEKLTCTACHAGPWPTHNLHRVQTSLAHGLGLASRERQDDDAPAIVGPVFDYDHKGRIAPQWQVYPQYWGFIRDERVTLTPREVWPTPRPADAPATPLSHAEIETGLKQLAAADDDAGQPVYIQGGWLWWRVRTRISARRHPAAEAYAWSLGHDVRPASQSLGAQGCTDCHARNAPFYFGTLVANPNDPRPPHATMTELRDDGRIANLMAASIPFRPLFKAFGFTCAAIILITLVRHAFTARPAEISVTPPAGPQRAFIWLFAGALLANAISGLFVGWYLDRFTGVALQLHMFGAAALILATTGLAASHHHWPPIVGNADSRATGSLHRPRPIFWSIITLAFATMTTMLLAMTPLFGYIGQARLLQSHRWLGLALLIITAFGVIAARIQRQQANDKPPVATHQPPAPQ